MAETDVEATVCLRMRLTEGLDWRYWSAIKAHMEDELPRLVSECGGIEPEVRDITVRTDRPWTDATADGAPA